MRRLYEEVLEQLNNVKEQIPEESEYVKALISQMDEVVEKINHQNERYDALNKKLSEIETSKDDEEVRSVWSRRTRIRMLLSTVSRMN